MTLACSYIDIAFTGGPADGLLCSVATGLDGQPPEMINQLGVVRDSYDEHGNPMYRQCTHRYRREVSALDTGPLWVYAYEGDSPREGTS